MVKTAKKIINKKLVLAFLSLSTFMIFLDGTVVNTALPDMARDFTATNATLQWIVNMYSLILAGFLLFAGSVGDKYGRKLVLGAGMAVFGLASVGAALANSTDMLIAMRGLQGLGAAFALPATLSIITNVFPRNERGKAIATWTAIGSLGIAFGPVIGGYLVDQIGWNAVFWVHVPVVLLALYGLKFIPESKEVNQTPLDVPGAVLGTGAMLAIVYAIIQGGEAGWTDTTIIASFVGGFALLLAFLVSQMRSKNPMLPLKYFKQKDFSGSFLVLLLVFLGMVGVFFFLTQYYQLVQGRTALAAGLAIAPVTITMIMGTMISAKTVPKYGPRNVIIASTLVIIAGMAIFNQLQVDSSIWLPISGILLFGLGAGTIMPTVTDSIMASVSVDDAGVGSAMNDLSRELGLALGIAILGSVVTANYRSTIDEKAHAILPAESVDQLSESIASVGPITAELPAEAAQQVTIIANNAFVDALSVGFIGAALFVVSALVVAVLFIPKRSRTSQAN
ncbi:MAG: EmrB/QacA subfamily drug resistance transporter [Candidatus Saccharimonadales bacterium]|jgi:EmrB/QacA subfamily drug resistance transporter